LRQLLENTCRFGTLLLLLWVMSVWVPAALKAAENALYEGHGFSRATEAVAIEGFSR